ncbi:hypothetical protein [Arthrobacter sp. lap29]|uniref:hypothetical protein n=1 Tax=Arthrobacter sp. lap29 TaxID=3056122 RepID=UPI0028F71144|nr:hypothetical protein [Arthrobacter sp. lap29]
MEFMTFLAVIGLVMSTALIGFAVGGFNETGRETGKKPETTNATVAFGLLIVAVCCSFILIEPAVIHPLWLEYVILAAVPAMAGYIARRYLAYRLSNSGT